MSATTYRGWRAQDVSNDWVHLIVVPQVGGRVMQVQFGGHEYLFVNPKFEGRYTPPAEVAKGSWINYGGDKLWPLPEGNGPGQWPGPISDGLDDGEYEFRVLKEGTECRVQLSGPADPATGLQFSREIAIAADSPQISFHALVKNASDHAIRWSVQSVSQYNTEDAQDKTRYNHDFWAFAPVNPRSVFVDGHSVQAGLANDPSFSVADGLFKLHWMYLMNEVWLDSPAGWVAVVDAAAGFGMVENFHFSGDAEYPGHASVIFYKNGATLDLDSDAMPRLRGNDPRNAPYYMEAELNSPMVALKPAQSFSFDTVWHPVRAGKELRAVNAAGVVEGALTASIETGGLHLKGHFGVFCAGKLMAYLYGGGKPRETKVLLREVDPLHAVQLDQTIAASAKIKRVVLHVIDRQGADLGILSEAMVVSSPKQS